MSDPKDVAKVIKGAAGLAALVPGVAMLAKVVPVPPTAANIITATSLAMGVAVVVAIMLLQPAILRLSRTHAALLVLGCAALGVWVGIQYASFATIHVVEFTNAAGQPEKYIKPLVPSTRLASILVEFGNDYGEALNSPKVGPQVHELLSEEGGSALALLVFYLLAAQTLLLAAIIGGAWKASQLVSEKQTP